MARLVLVPTIVMCAVGFYGAIAWTVGMSFTSSSILPRYDFVGLEQYRELWGFDRWRVAYANMFVFGGLYVAGSLGLGIVLAIALDQGVRAQTAFQTAFLYPIALSFIVTGLAWQWFLNPTTGLQAFVRSLGWEGFTFDWLNRPDLAIYTVVIAGVWHAAGLMMVIVFAGLRSIDAELWRAARVEGIPRATMYLRVILPMLRPVLATCVVLLAMDVVKSYELIVAMTGGGPGYATDLPAKFVVDHFFDRADIGRAAAGATVMLLTVLAVLLVAPLLRWGRARA